MGAEVSSVVIPIVIVGLGIWTLNKGIYIVKEKEVLIIERFGKFSRTLGAGPSCIIPFVDRPKTYSHRYTTTDQNDNIIVHAKKNHFRVSTQNEVLDFPKQAVITRDNAQVFLDAVLQFKISNPKQMIYNTQNLPHMLSRILQANIRNVAGMLDVDQLIEDKSVLQGIKGEIDTVARDWGVNVDDVKIQRVEAGSLNEVLARKKNADLKNKEIIINAKAERQTTIINAEGNRDKMTKEAEGQAQQIMSRARGEAQAIRNAAVAEARSVKEIARALSNRGENPTKYLLALKYIDTLKMIVGQPNTKIEYFPNQSSFLQITQSLGLNTVYPRSK